MFTCSHGYAYAKYTFSNIGSSNLQFLCDKKKKITPAKIFPLITKYNYTPWRCFLSFKNKSPIKFALLYDMESVRNNLKEIHCYLIRINSLTHLQKKKEETVQRTFMWIVIAIDSMNWESFRRQCFCSTWIRPKAPGLVAVAYQ